MKRLIYCFILLSLAVNTRADVIRINNGQVYLGKITSADSEGILIDSFGKKRAIPQSEILKSEKSLETLQSQQVQIFLKDGSIFRGKIENYDEEMGIFINIDFGPMTVPVDSIKEIIDPGVKEYYESMIKVNPVNIGFTGGYYLTAGPAGSRYNSNYNFSFFTEFYTYLLKGLFAGIDMGYLPVDYKNSAEIEFNIITFQPYLSYRYGNLKRSRIPLVKDLVPFFSAGAGIAYTRLKDNRPLAANSEKSESDMVYSARLGCDYLIYKNILIRLFGGWESILQKNKSFDAVLINAGALYSF